MTAQGGETELFPVDHFEMVSRIGSETNRYEGTRYGPLQRFSGSHEVYYVQTGERGLLVGAWEPEGLEELIPASGSRYQIGRVRLRICEPPVEV
jgi:hypothetical protein